MDLTHLPEEDLKEILRLTEAKKKLEIRETAHKNFMPFAHHVYENFIEGRHHRIIAEKLERVANGELKRLIINMPPRHSKSEFASYLMPAWFLGRNPKLKIIQATHNTELAVRFGRKVRDLLDDPQYKEVFPNTQLKDDNKGAGNWQTTAGGEYYAAGVGSAVTGRGADLFVIDDPHSEQDALSETAFEHAYEWYTSGPRQRLQPGGSIILVMCMTGDTLVSMADGTQKELRDIRPSDRVLSYSEGRIVPATVLNWQSSGFDSIFTIQTRSGKILKANERHPFLVERKGYRKWVKLRDLKVGDTLVSLKDAPDELEQKLSPVYATLAKQGRVTERKIPGPNNILSVTTDDGLVSLAKLVDVIATQWQKAFVQSATTGSLSPRKPQSNLENTASNIDMASLLSSMKQWLWSEIIAVISAVRSLQQPILAPIGMGSSVSTIAMIAGSLGASSVTTATLPLVMGRHPQILSEQPSICETTSDEIVSIDPSGTAEVFDVEVAKTGNFIANGVVTHNTRWGKKDLTGRLIAQQASDPMADQWEVVEFPAILPSDEVLWPEFWTKEAMLSIKASLPVSKWSAQWQQQPTSAESAIVKREWWQLWEHDKMPPVKYILQAYDTAFSKKETADYSAITTWGIFDDQESGREAIMLLDARRGRWNFPELKEIAFSEHDYWEPDMVIVEAKASGRPLIDELRKRGIPAVGFSPGRKAGGGGVDKTTRMHLVSPLFESGVVWAPDNRRFADEVIEEVASFPAGDHDDYVDSMTLALMRFREGGLISIKVDEDDEEDFIPRKREYY